jgi:hypothetical protein
VLGAAALCRGRGGPGAGQPSARSAQRQAPMLGTGLVREDLPHAQRRRRGRCRRTFRTLGAATGGRGRQRVPRRQTLRTLGTEAGGRGEGGAAVQEAHPRTRCSARRPGQGAGPVQANPADARHGPKLTGQGPARCRNTLRRLGKAAGAGAPERAAVQEHPRALNKAARGRCNGPLGTGTPVARSAQAESGRVGRVPAQVPPPGARRPGPRIGAKRERPRPGVSARRRAYPAALPGARPSAAPSGQAPGLCAAVLSEARPPGRDRARLSPARRRSAPARRRAPPR